MWTMIKGLGKWSLHLHSYTASLRNTQVNGIDGISNTISFCTQFTYRFFCSPHAWNNEIRLLGFGKSKWNWRSKVWKISTLISLIVTLTQILMEFGYILIFHEVETNIVSFRRVQILGSISALIVQLNTVWKVKEYQEFINQYLQLFRQVEKDHILPPSTFNRIFWVTRILVIFFLLMVLYFPIAFVIFIGYPEIVPNIFSKLLPRVFTRTSVVGRREHWNPIVASAVCFLEFTVLSQQCCHVLNYASFICIGSISWLQLLQELKIAIAKGQDNANSALLDLDYFIKLYKSASLVANRLNDWIASVVIPGVVSIGMVIIVSINYTLLTATTNGFQKMTLLTGELGIGLCLGVCIQMASFVSFRSKECLRAMAVRRATADSKYNSRRLRGCMDCRAYFGSLFYFSQTSILIFGHYIVDYTIQTVITFP